MTLFRRRFRIRVKLPRTVAAFIGNGRIVRRFARDENGATAVEFGLVALPFIALLMAILQTALVFFAGQTIETAVSRAGRLVRTGQAQEQNMSAEQFKAEVCRVMASLFSCGERLMVDVRTYATFDSIGLTKPIDANGNLIKDFVYQPGDGGDIVVVRAFYEWPMFASLLGFNLANLANGNHLLAATAAFRNEPF
jgi:Flp pilus assembly protein TadG